MPFTSQSFTETTSSLDLFQYNSEAMADEGVAYHYIKSNQDDSYSADEWNYIESPAHTESFKIYPFSRIQGKTDLVVADYNIEKYFTSNVTAYLISKNGDRNVNATTTSEDGIEYKFSFGNDSYSVTVGHVPSYNYNFDWCDFTFMYRHLINKESRFEIGVLVPNSSIKFIYAGKATIEYIDTRSFKDRNCRFYKVYGEAFGDKEGALYMDAESNFLVEINMPLKNNGNYNSFKYTLVDSIKMTKEEWNSFINEKTSAHLYF
jgi:hypothetical protein